MSELSNKQCSICEEWFPSTTEYFYKNKSSKEGLFPYCKQCAVIKTLKNRNENRDENLKKMRKYGREYMKQPEKILQTRERSKKYREQGKIIEWQHNNKDKIKDYNANRKHKNHDITKDEWESCKKYFNDSCAYCGISEVDAKELYKQKLHKEHVDHNGSNDLSNCVPDCKQCNSEKHTYELNQWYNKDNPKFKEERLNRVLSWLSEFTIKN